MRTVLIFLLILAPTAITACNYWSLAKCGYKAWRTDDSISNGTMLEKIDKRVKECDFVNDCGEVTLTCSKEEGFKRYEMQKTVDAGKTGCALIHRMYKDDFVSCAIALEKHYWNRVCYTRKYDLSETNMYDAFTGCVAEYVKKECSDDQYRIFEGAHDMLRNHLRLVLKQTD